MCQRPLETRDIGRTQTQLAAPLNEEETVAKLGLHQPVHNLRRAIGTTVVDNEYVETLIQ